VLRKIFGPKGDEETGNLYDLYSSNQEDEMGGACVMYGRQNRCIQGSGGQT